MKILPASLLSILAMTAAASNITETLTFSPTNRFTVLFTCKVVTDGMGIDAVLKETGDILFSTEVAELSRCSDVVDYSEDFNNDGIADVSIKNAPHLPSTTLQIYLISIEKSGLRAVYAGNLPISASKNSDGSYVSLSNEGGSIYQLRYMFDDKAILVLDAKRKIIAGDICIDNESLTEGLEKCDTETVQASFDKPICVDLNRGNAVIPASRCVWE
ncbi:MAG: hypothetical protein ACN6PB_24495 [Achromobacter kerstersii]|uniref:hypothetical protein n=1 Tax=Achromobacter kerstersii TaxID=1353890 RepID=UPI003D014F93